MKFKTVREGQQAVVFNHMGEGRLIIGPERVFLFRERLSILTPHTATQYQYLVLKDKEGVVTHKRGPCEIFKNPLLYDDVKVFEATRIDANHLVVVYKRLKDNDVQRRIIQGPTVFVPEAEEWLHMFEWHGTEDEDKAHMKPKGHTFSQLAVIPAQFYYNVRDVRTVDDTMITVKLMLFYEIVDIIKMLDTTHDPIADMINAVCADTIAFAGQRTFDVFLQQTDKLSQLDTYPQLQQRVQRIGFRVQKIVFRGYHASEHLQMMQCNAIESRTKFRLNTELQEQTNKLAEMRLNKEEARTKMKQEMEEDEQRHLQDIANLQQVHDLQLRAMKHDHQLQKDSLRTQLRIESQTLENNQAVDTLRKMDALGVNVTSYLIGQLDPKVDEEVLVTQV